MAGRSIKKRMIGGAIFLRRAPLFYTATSCSPRRRLNICAATCVAAASLLLLRGNRVTPACTSVHRGGRMLCGAIFAGGWRSIFALRRGGQQARLLYRHVKNWRRMAQRGSLAARNGEKPVCR